jgi:signal transduction histidine kinase
MAGPTLRLHYLIQRSHRSLIVSSGRLAIGDHSKMMDKLKDIVDFFIHPQARIDMFRLIRVRSMVVLGLIYLLTILFIIVLSPSFEIVHLYLTASVVVSFLIGKYTGRHELLARASMIILMVVILYFLLRSGSMRMEISFWIPATVVAALIVGGSMFGSLILVCLTGVVTLVFYGKILPAIPPAEVAGEMAYFRHFLLATFVIYTVAFIYERTNTALIKLAEKRRLDLDLQKQKTIEASHLSSLGEMAGGIAHEINNPLAIIRGNTEVLVRIARDDAQIRVRLDKIIQTVERIEKIIHSMRSLSRQDYKGDFQLESLSLIIEEVMVFFSEKMRSLGYQLDVQLDPSIEANCQRVQVGQVIINLMNNAIDALQEANLEESWIQLRLKLNEQFAEIMVINSGPKIKEELARNLMRPFYTTKPVGKGTGLGLSISKHFAEQHGGELNLDLSGHHTTFILRLPAQRRSVASGL